SVRRRRRLRPFGDRGRLRDTDTGWVSVARTCPESITDREDRAGESRLPLEFGQPRCKGPYQGTASAVPGRRVSPAPIAATWIRSAYRRSCGIRKLPTRGRKQLTERW